MSVNPDDNWVVVSYISPRTLGFHDPIWRLHIFLNGLVQPPTRQGFQSLRFFPDSPQNPWTSKSAKSGPLGIGHEVIGVLLPKACLGFGFENGWGKKTGESNPITDPWDERYIYLHFFVDFYGKWYIYLHLLDFYGKSREIYQSHGWYGNGTDAIKNPLGERTAVAGKISINLYPLKNPKNPVAFNLNGTNIWVFPKNRGILPPKWMVDYTGKPY